MHCCGISSKPNFSPRSTPGQGATLSPKILIIKATRRFDSGENYLNRPKPVSLLLKLSFFLGLAAAALATSCGAGGNPGSAVGAPDSAMTTGLGPVGGGASGATGDLMGAKGDSEALPAGSLKTRTACLALAAGSSAPLNPGGDAVKTPVPASESLSLQFKGTFETDLGATSSLPEINCAETEAVKGALIRAVWSSDEWPEPKYRDFLVAESKDANLAVSGLNAKSGDRLAFFYYDEAYFVTDVVDEKERKTAIRHDFAQPDFPAGATTPPAAEWKVISKDDVVYFSGIKRADGKIMFVPMGSLQFD